MHPTLQNAFDQSQVLKVISGLNNFDAKRVAATVKAADRGGATFVDIAADADLVRLVRNLTKLPISKLLKIVIHFVNNDFVFAYMRNAKSAKEFNFKNS